MQYEFITYTYKVEYWQYLTGVRNAYVSWERVRSKLSVPI